MSRRLRRIGFVIDGRFPHVGGLLRRECGIPDFLWGTASPSPVGFMRFGWIAEAVNAGEGDLRYELYTPWRRYDAVVFLKSMGRDCLALARRLKRQGVRIVFDANVDYLTPAEGTFYYEGMAPTEAQRRDMLDMLAEADAVIADSEHIAQRCREVHPKVVWIPDNVNMTLIPARPERKKDNRLTVLWSGASCKVFDLLAIAPVLRAYADRARLVFVTDNLSGMRRCFEPYRRQLKDLLAGLEHEFVAFQSIGQLFSLYASGDLFVSPRFLDNSYNLGHTEWKITLPMACGLFVLASPQPSYRIVFERSGGRGLRLCDDGDRWSACLEDLLCGRLDVEQEIAAAKDAVSRYYATDVVAAQHASLMKELLA